MNEHELESFIMATLANADGWVDFIQIDKALAAKGTGWKDGVRQSYLRGAVGRMIRDGRIIREKNRGRYKIGDETLNLFQ